MQGNCFFKGAKKNGDRPERNGESSCLKNWHDNTKCCQPHLHPMKPARISGVCLRAWLSCLMFSWWFFLCSSNALLGFSLFNFI